MRSKINALKLILTRRFSTPILNEKRRRTDSIDEAILGY